MKLPAVDQGRPGHHVEQQALTEVAEKRFSRADHRDRGSRPRGAERGHRGDVPGNGRLIEIREDLPCRVELERGGALGALTARRCDLPGLDRRDVLLAHDHLLDDLAEPVPEEKIRPELEILGRVQSDEVNIVQGSDDVGHRVAADLPGRELESVWNLFVDVPMQLEGGQRRAAGARQQEEAAAKRVGNRLWEAISISTSTSCPSRLTTAQVSTLASM